MKKFRLFLMVIFLISVGFSFQQISAQEKSKEELDKEQKIRLEIYKQKKEMADQKKTQEDAEAAANDQWKFRLETEKRDSLFRYLPRGNRSLIFDEQFNLTGSDMQPFYAHSMFGDTERTTLDFSKTVKDNTFSREYSFAVEKSVKSVVMSVMGDCKAGEIHIKIVMPNGKNYSDILIDESGNLNWRKSFTIS
jgi:hypothetical protein